VDRMTESSRVKYLKKLATDVFILPYFSPKMTLYSTFTEQTTWYPCLVWVRRYRQEKGTYMYMERVTWPLARWYQECTGSQLRYLKGRQPLPRIFHLRNTWISVLLTDEYLCEDTSSSFLSRKPPSTSPYVKDAKPERIRHAKFSMPLRMMNTILP